MKKDKISNIISTIIFCGCVIKTVKTIIYHEKLNGEINKELIEEK